MKSEKLLAVAEELKAMVDDLRDVQVGSANKEVLLKQSLYGVQVSMQNVLAQIKLSIKIEALNGNIG